MQASMACRSARAAAHGVNGSVLSTLFSGTAHCYRSATAVFTTHHGKCSVCLSAAKAGWQLHQAWPSLYLLNAGHSEVWSACLTHGLLLVRFWLSCHVELYHWLGCR